MSDDPQSPRQPFGQRDEEDKKLPFGSRPRPTGTSPRRESYPDGMYDEPSSDALRTPPSPPARPSRMPAVPGSLDSLLSNEDDPSDLPWDALLSDVDAPSDSRYRKEEEKEPDASPRDKRSIPVPPPERSGERLRLPKRSFLKQRSGTQEIATASYVEDLPDDEPIERPQVVIRFGTVFRSMTTIVFTAMVIATLFTWWTPGAFLPPKLADQLAIAQATQSSQQIIPQSTSERTIGIVSGHRGLYPATGLPDPGAVCPDGLTEQQVNENVARQVEVLLEREGYQVDLLDEFDTRLQGYQALAVVSIHADSCDYINDQATGFKVASFTYSTVPDVDARLVSCLTDRYAAATGLPFHPSVTDDMTNYHNFQEIAPGVPGAVIEIGFLHLDRILLTERADAVAYGIKDGILCFLRNEMPTEEATQLPPTESMSTPIP